MELGEIRKRIDAVDEKLLELFLRRMSLSEEVAACKREQGLPILNRQREQEILSWARERSGDLGRFSHCFFATLFELGRARQAELISRPTAVSAQISAALERGGELFPQTGVVACRGEEGTDSQLACDRLFPRSRIVYFRTLEEVASAVATGLCQFGLLPMENSSDGSVRQVYELLRRHSLFILRSTRLCVRRELPGLPGEEREDDIQNNSYTRSVCVAAQPAIYAGANRISLVLSAENRPGALCEVLCGLAALGINLTRLESAPVEGRDSEFLFFLEIEASVHDSAALAILQELESSCPGFRFLGSYAEV